MRGALYDMRHMSELPPAKNGENPTNVQKYVLYRDDRMMYILYMASMVVLIVLFIVYLVQLLKQLKPKQPNAVYLAPQPEPRNAFV